MAEEWRSFWLARLVRPEVPQQPPDHAGRHNEDNRAARRPVMAWCGRLHRTSTSAPGDDAARCTRRKRHEGESTPSGRPGHRTHRNLSRAHARRVLHTLRNPPPSSRCHRPNHSHRHNKSICGTSNRQFQPGLKRPRPSHSNESVFSPSTHSLRLSSAAWFTRSVHRATRVPHN